MKKIMFILSLLSICETMHAEKIVLLDSNGKKVIISSNQIVKTYPWSAPAMPISNKGYLKITNIDRANTLMLDTGILLQDTLTGNYYVDLSQFKPGIIITFSNYPSTNDPLAPISTQQFTINK